METNTNFFVAISPLLFLLVFILGMGVTHLTYYTEESSNTILDNTTITYNLTCPQPICPEPVCINNPVETIILHRWKNGTENPVNGLHIGNIGYFVATGDREERLIDRTALHEQLHAAVTEDHSYWCNRYHLGEHFCP